MIKAILITLAWLGWLVAAPAVGADFPSPSGAKPAEQSAPKSPQPVPSGAELIRLTTLLVAVNRFKQVSLEDYEKALLMFATADAVAKFRGFNKHIWVQTSPRMGWSYFMSSSIHAVGGAGRLQPLVAFYNPWSDVFLITEWRLDEDIPRLIDAELLMGDWLRSGDGFNSVPHWLRSDAFKPAALGTSVAQSIQGFEELFQRTRDASWRQQLPVLVNQQLLTEVNYPAVALMLLNNLLNIHEFRTPKNETNPKMAACRRLTADLIGAGTNSQLERMRNMPDETLPQTWALLKSLDPKWFRTLEAVTVVNGKDGCLVFLAPVLEATGSLSLFFKGKKASLSLQRVDLIDYAGFYQGLVGKGGASGKEISL